MMQWVPWGQSLPDFKNHVRTFSSVFPYVMVMSGPGGNGFYMIGSDSALSFSAANVRSALSRPGVLEDVSSAYDSPLHDLDSWAAAVPQLVRLSPSETKRFAGRGPLITDDNPLPEYFLLREARSPHAWLTPADIQAER
jgi:hypothetical protein